MNWQQLMQLLNSGVQTIGTGVNAVNSLASNPTVRSLTGAGLIGAGLSQKEEPGYATESIQYLRNRLAPQGIASQFSGQIGALNEEYRPYLEQQRNQLLDQSQQRFIAGQPSSFSTAMSGPEIGAIRNAITNQILPGERAHIADIGQYLLSQGGSAAGRLLDYAKPDPLGEYLATLGVNLLGGRGGQAGQPGTGGGGQLGQQLLSAFGGNTSVGDAISQAVGLANTAGDASKLTALLSSGILKGTPFPIGLQASTPAGQAVQQAINAGLVESPAAISTSGAGGGVLASPLATVLGLAGAGAVGYGAGQLVSRVGQNQFQSSAGGALAGAAAGAAIGSAVPGIGTAVGAVVGGIAGLFGGFGGERGQQAQEKAMRLASDADSQKDQILELGNIGAQFGQQLGIPTSVVQAFMAQAQQLADTSASPADEQTMIAQALGTMLRQYVPAEQWAALAPQLRRQFIDYMTRNVGTAPNERFGGGPNPESIQQWAGMIGLSRGGFVNRPSNALVGERGVELAHLEPGSYVIPFDYSRN